MRGPPPGRRQEVLELVPGRLAKVERTLSLEGDRLLADHLFVSAEGVKPPAERVPVAPLALSLAVAADVAGLLAPGRRLVAAGEVQASRWIQPSADGLVRLVCEATAERAGGSPIRVKLTETGSREPSLSASFSFAAPGASPGTPVGLPELVGARRSRLDAEAIYRERLFHGPSLRTLASHPWLAENGAEGELLAPRTGRSGLDPVTLDGVAQLLGLWGTERCLDLFPVGLDLLRLHARSPRRGRLLRARIVVTRTETRLVEADGMVWDGSAVWFELRGLRMGASAVSERVLDARRQPERFLLGQRLRMPGLPGDAVCVVVSAEDLGGSLDVVARTWLTPDELEKVRREGATARSWLAARVAAKDAARCWSAGGSGDMPHPASFSIDEHGFPVGLAGRVPSVALSKAGRRQQAVARERPVSDDPSPPHATPGTDPSSA
ncbi:MAG: hotdog family protein [Thermoanaerobaculia bacterium]